MADITSIPAARVPLLEPGGAVMSREWYRFFFNQFGQTGSGTTPVSISDLELAPSADAGVEAVSALRDDIHAAQVGPPPRPLTPTRFAAFANSATQTLSAANTATAVTYNTVVTGDGVGLSSSSRVTPGVAGTYLIALTAQLDKTGSGDALAWFWLRRNGVDIANTAKRWRIRGQDAEVVFAITIILSVAQTDYLEVMWAADDATVTLDATPATAFSPAGPSSLFSITQVLQ